MTPFQLIIELATPFHMRHKLTLDALLSAAVYNKTGLQAEDTIPLIPLVREHDIFKASSIIFPRVYRHSTMGRLMSLRGESDLSVNAFSPNWRANKYGFVDQKRGSYKTNLSVYTALAAKEVHFYGVGDPVAVAELIQSYIPGIGKRANGGAGEIIAVQWLPSEDFSWIAESGRPARPLPVDLWRAIGGNYDAPSAPLSVKLPYWCSEKIPAVFPY